MADGERIETEKELVRDGFAARYVRYDKVGEFTDAEREAREKRRGSWMDPNPVPPWRIPARETEDGEGTALIQWPPALPF
jgi:endonuclease YncB( thermonuclease family)